MSIPFARRRPNREEYTSFSYTDDTDEKLPKDKDIVYQSSSGVESYRNASKSRKKREKKRDKFSTSSDCTSEPTKLNSSRSSRRKPRMARIESPQPRYIAETPKPGRSAESKKYGSVEEAQPLLVQNNEEPFKQEHIVAIPKEPVEENIETESASKTERFWSLFVVFLMPFLAGLTLIIGVNVNSDLAAREINPAVFHYYVVGLISIFILRVAYQIIQNWRHGIKGLRDETAAPLIPSHLLNGLVLFGLFNSAFQIIMVLDIFKCSRSVSGLDKSYVVIAFMEITFVFGQIYIFYTLSRRRQQKPWFGNLFTMFMLSINMTVWAGYFCAGAVNHPDLKNVTWLRRYHYGLEQDLCASVNNNTGYNSRKLHSFIVDLMQYKFTFAMEYSLLASALLLHLWRELGTPSAGEFPTNTKWVVWRFGFLPGLFTLPLLGCIGVYTTVEYDLKSATFLYIAKFAIYLSILLCSIGGCWLFKKHYTRKTDVKIVKVDGILLCFSTLGFLVIDLFTIFATLAEISKTYSGHYLVLGFASLCELLSIFTLTAFILASYVYKVNHTVGGVNAAKKIRQISSFFIPVCFGLWAMRTYTFRSDYYFDIVGHNYFRTMPWFVITQFFSPMCIFYWFHSAICLLQTVSDSTIPNGQLIKQN